MSDELLTPLEASTRDLDRIEDDLRWAHSNGYWPAGRAIGAERGASLAKPEHERERGPRHDFGIGDHASRVAFACAVERLAEAEVYLAGAVMYGARRAQPPLMKPTARNSIPFLMAVVTSLRWRVEVRQLDEGEERWPKEAQRSTAKAAKALERCVSSLARALNRGPARPADGMRWCTICRRRPCRSGDKKRCETCNSWKFRHNGQERPRKLDRGENDPRHAAARRRQRGEGWGAA